MHAEFRRYCRCLTSLIIIITLSLHKKPLKLDFLWTFVFFFLQISLKALESSVELIWAQLTLTDALRRWRMLDEGCCSSHSIGQTDFLLQREKDVSETSLRKMRVFKPVDEGKGRLYNHCAKCFYWCFIKQQMKIKCHWLCRLLLIKSYLLLFFIVIMFLPVHISTHWSFL